MLVYAHNMGYGNLGFTELQNCYRTDCFANIGAVTFTKANGNTVHHEAVTHQETYQVQTGTKQVLIGYRCSGCGATK